MRHAACDILDRLWRPGYGWRKAGVLLLDLVPVADAPDTLFERLDRDASPLMTAVDRLNGRFGRNTIRFGLTAGKRSWHCRQVQNQAVEELALLPAHSAIARMLADYGVMREQTRGDGC